MNLKSKIRGVVFGTAVGDALGYPLEFVSKPSRKLPTPLELEVNSRGVGLYSDDTQMTVAVLNGLLRAQRHGGVTFAAEEVASELVAWYDSPENNRAPGNACMAACSRLKIGEDWRLSGGPTALGSGAAMRSQAYGIWKCHNTDEAYRWAAIHAQMTHRHPGAMEGAGITAAVTSFLMKIERGRVTRGDLETVVQAYGGHHDPDAIEMILDAIRSEQRAPEVVLDKLTAKRSDDAIAAALYVLLKAGRDFDSAMRMSVLNCADADTAGCLTGALMGALYGVEVIPQNLIEKIEHREELEALCLRLESALEGA